MLSNVSFVEPYYHLKNSASPLVYISKFVSSLMEENHAWVLRNCSRSAADILNRRGKPYHNEKRQALILFHAVRLFTHRWLELNPEAKEEGYRRQPFNDANFDIMMIAACLLNYDHGNIRSGQYATTDSNAYNAANEDGLLNGLSTYETEQIYLLIKAAHPEYRSGFRDPLKADGELFKDLEFYRQTWVGQILSDALYTEQVYTTKSNYTEQSTRYAEEFGPITKKDSESFLRDIVGKPIFPINDSISEAQVAYDWALENPFVSK